MKNVMIAPSILDVKVENLPDALARIEKAGASYVHVDVMDGKFVPNTSFSLREINDLFAICELKKDVHIMIENPLQNAIRYLEISTDILTFHLEACADEEEAIKLINMIHSYNKKAGVSIKPKTSVSELKNILPLVDLVLVMSVEPGLGGQPFMMHSLDKIRELKNLREENNYSYIIEVDGGIKPDTGKLCHEAGVDMLVSGSYIFKENKIEERMKDLFE